MKILWFISLVVLAFPAYSNDHNGKTTPEVLTTSAIVEMILGLILILALIFILAWLIKRTGRFHIGAKGTITLVDSLSLGPKERIVLFEIDGQRFVAGVTPNRINSLQPIDHSSDHHRQNSGQSFDQQLDKLMAKE